MTFQYTDDEIAGLTEANLRLYQADNINGPYTELSTTIDAATNRATANVTSYPSSFDAYFLLSDVSGLPVELDTFLVD